MKKRSFFFFKFLFLIYFQIGSSLFSNAQTNNALGKIETSVLKPDLMSEVLDTSFVVDYHNTGVIINGYTKNVGDSIIQSTLTGFFLSRDTIYGPGDVLVTSFHTDRIEPQQYSYFNIPIGLSVIPFGHGSPELGRYYILSKADYTGSIEEPNENDNISYVAIDVIAFPIDLSISNIRVQDIPLTAGGRVYISVDITNKGKIPGTGSTFVYLSKDTEISPDDYFSGSYGENDMQANSTLTRIYQVYLDNSLKTGDYYLIFKTDGYNDFIETNEDNNTSFVKINIQEIVFLGINNMNKSSGSLSVAPNPLSDAINITINNSASKQATFELYDSYGAKSKEGILTIENGKFTIPAYDLSKGVYLLKLDSEGKIETLKIIKE